MYIRGITRLPVITRVNAAASWLSRAPSPALPAQAIRRLLSTRPRSATLEADLLEAARAALPSTHLQREGQRLLLRAQALLPALLALPTRPPAWVLAAALAAPFAAAVEEVGGVHTLKGAG